MAVYAIVDADNTSGRSDDPAMCFKYRHYSSSGQRTAQQVFDTLRHQGRNVVLVRWERDRIVAREPELPSK